MANRTPLVSVVMAVYNGGDFLEESITSILTQTLSDFEFIIVNDGSIDGTKDMLDFYSQNDKRIRVIHQDNQGLSPSLNTGLKHARGEFVARMDADDVSHPDRLRIQSQILQSNLKAGLCHSFITMVDDHGSAIPLKRMVGFRLTSWQTRWTLLWRNCINHPTVMLRRNVLLEHKLNYSTSAKGCEDYELWSRMSKVCDFVVVQRALLFYRRHSTSVTQNYGETHLENFSHVISKNLMHGFGQQVDSLQLRELAAISGQTYLQGKNLKIQTGGSFFIKLVDAITEKFIAVHELDSFVGQEVRQAAANQFLRWAWKAAPANALNSIQFLLAALRYKIFL